MLPITILKRLSGANGRNWPGYVQLDPDAPLRAAVWAQEAWESMYKMNPMNLLRVRLSRKYRRRMEIMGHEVEVQAAAMVYGISASKYRMDESGSMKNGYNGLFDSMSRTQLIAAMEAVAPDAARWVRRNRGRIERWRL